mgnify:FL=1
MTEPVIKISGWTDRTDCPTCASSDIQMFCANIQVHRPTTRWSICNVCQHVFVNPYPEAKWLNDWYHNGYRKMTHRLEEEDPEKIPVTNGNEELGRAVYVMNVLMRWRGPDKIASHLDIGSSTGALLAAMMDRFLVEKSVGVEPNNAWRAFSVNSFQKYMDTAQESVKNAHPRNFHVYENLKEVPKTPKFDLVTCIHTLEHIVEIGDIIKGASTRMKPNGYLMIAVPYLFGGFADPLMFPHLHVFTAKTLTHALELNGMAVELFETGHTAAPFWMPSNDMMVIAKKAGASQEMTKTRLLEVYQQTAEVNRNVQESQRKMPVTYSMG